jgi:hypothetical protein
MDWLRVNRWLEAKPLKLMSEEDSFWGFGVKNLPLFKLPLPLGHAKQTPIARFRFRYRQTVFDKRINLLSK